jgi:FAD/FMN-containing dehydrogenase
VVEGTLAFTTEVTLKVDALPPSKISWWWHFHSIQESLEAVVVAMKHHLYTCEMIDDTILDCTKTIGNKARIGFLQGEPKAIMIRTSDAMEDTEGRRMR